jgi:hypothetical protein
MLRVRGIYDGERVRLLEDVNIPPDTEVEVLVPDEIDPNASEDEQEEAYWKMLREKGIVLQRPRPDLVDDDFEPIPNPGEPISDTIIRERR